MSAWVWDPRVIMADGETGKNDVSVCRCDGCSVGEQVHASLDIAWVRWG